MDTKTSIESLKVVVKRSKVWLPYYLVKSPNGQVMLTSELYANASNAVRAAKNFMSAADDHGFVYRNKLEDWRR